MQVGYHVYKLPIANIAFESITACSFFAEYLYWPLLEMTQILDTVTPTETTYLELLLVVTF